jgi:DNA polymerase elongation subunit (family B)
MSEITVSQKIKPSIICNDALSEHPITNHQRHKKIIKTKSFRLFDFHAYDEFPHEIENGSDDSENDSNDGKYKSREKRQFVIQMFGINELGKTCCLYIMDYQPFFYVKVGDDWTNETVYELKNDLIKRSGYHGESISEIILENHKKLYGFTSGKSYNFVKIVFKNSAAMNKVKNMWYGEKEGERARIPFVFKQTTLELYESNIPPLLRYFHINNVSPSGWIQILLNRVKIPKNKTTTCDFEYICNLTSIQPIAHKETRVPYKICSFDIEASSSHGDFPVPIKSYKRLATNIVDIFTNTLNKITDINEKKDHLKQMIHAAFGFGNYSDLDLVYPKYKPNEKELEKLFQIFIKMTVQNAKKTNLEENSKILTIDSLFEKRYQHEQSEMNHCGDDENSDNEEDEIEKVTTKKYAKSSKCNSIDSNTTILDILNHSSYDREQRIQFTNETLMSVFPKLEGDKVTFIGSTFMRYGESDPYMNHCLVLGTCDEVDGAIIETTETENDLLMKWTELVQKENPDIIIGYNIFGFDYEFMFRRAQENRCEKNFLMLSRKCKEICAKVDDNECFIENTKVVLASGEYDLRYYKTTGRLQIDMYTYFRRDFNLPSYKLDDVAGQYISDDIKKSIILDSNTHLYTQNIMGLHKNDYIHIEITGFTSDYFQDGKKFHVKDVLLNQILKEIGKDGTEKEISYNVIVIDGEYELPINKYGIKWGIAKDDVSPQDIFRLSNGSSTDRAKVAKYCIQDCNLVHHLMNKIDVITGYVEMSRICSVPISFLVFRGQGIKLTSFVAKKCREKGTLMPDLEKFGGNDGYEGAIVLPPKCSMYMDNPVACVDYSSLYPSSMISNNLSQDSKVWTKEYDLKGILIRTTGEIDKEGNYIYDNLPEYQYVDVEFDTFKYIRKTPTSRAEKVKSGTKICRWAQLPNNQKSIMPSILEELLKARSDTRKMIKTEKDPFMQNILDKRQLGYKVTANSLYGQCGAKTSTFYEQDVAASTTATGRLMITYAKRIIEEVYQNREYQTENHGTVLTKAEYIYGDSVTNYTPVNIRVKGKIIICKISELANKYGENKWITCKEQGKQEKEYCELYNVESWTDQGWTKLERVIRHILAPNKKIIRVLTQTGLVDVTDDHSLLSLNGKEITPKECNIGTELLHKTLDFNNSVSEEPCIFTKEQAQVMGFFFRHGSCGEYYYKSGKKCFWELNNASGEIIIKYFDLCKIAYPEFDWTVNNDSKNSNKYKIVTTSNIYHPLNEFTKKYRLLMYCDKSKIIPTEILNANIEIQKAFWKGMYDTGCQNNVNGCIKINQKNQLSASHIVYLANRLGWKTSINNRNDKLNNYMITLTNEEQKKNPNAIKKMCEIPYEGYVYDLTTKNHHFAAGIGNMIVHNTDSVFFTFNLEDPITKQPIRGKDALEITIEIAQDAAHLCTEFLKPPMELSYEKTLMPFVLLSKKRYVGMLYETDPNKGKLKYMGLSLKRRDSCDYLKDVYGEILNILMKENNIQKAIDYLDNALNDLIDGNVSMDKLMITRALRSDYKNPQQIAHKVLADRIGQRDPGNKPKPGDRIKFVFTQSKIINKKLLMGDRIETPEFIKENKLKIDYTHYITNQLMKPLQQLFGLAIEKIWEYQRKPNAIKTYKKDMAQLEKEFKTDYEMFMKRKEKYCSSKVKILLFDKILNKIANEKNHIQMITGFFK